MAMGFVSHLRCTACGQEYPADQVMNLCPADHKPVEILLDLERLQHERPGDGWYQPQRGDMWRFGGLLALDVDHPADAGNIVSLGEGHTPLLPYPRHTVAPLTGDEWLDFLDSNCRSGSRFASGTGRLLLTVSYARPGACAPGEADARALVDLCRNWIQRHEVQR